MMVTRNTCTRTKTNMSTTQHSSDPHVSDICTLEFTGIPNDIRESICEIRREFPSGLSRCSIEDDCQEDCFKIAISGRAIDVMLARIHIFRIIKKDLMLCANDDSIWTTISWEPRGEDQLNLCLPDKWRKIGCFRLHFLLSRWGDDEP